MENRPDDAVYFTIFGEEEIEKHFADLNIKLLSGRHIQQDEVNIFSVLEDYYVQLRLFYQKIYKLELVLDTADRARYYYLNFFDTGRGKLGDSSRYRTLTEMQTITGLLLLNMYYSRYFENPKVIRWGDIKQEIEYGDHRTSYQRVLFPEMRPGYIESEWTTVEKKFKTAIQSFHELGWVNRLSNSQEDLHFEIRPSIHRMAKLYAYELEHFETFVQSYNTHEEEE